jgi:hypothetical protein
MSAMPTEVTPNIWSFIRLEQYSRPPEPAQEAVRKGIFGLWDYLRWGQKTGPAFVEINLSQVPLDLLDRLAPVPDWAAAVPAVSAALKSWLEVAHPETPAQVFVGPSYNGTPQILAHWARERQLRLVEAPTPEEILAGGDDWLAQADDGADTPLVLTHLEHCYLRHYNGLTLLRRLLEAILSHRRRWLVACDSWAWVYFGQLFKVGAMFPSAWVLQAFDQERLQEWLPKLNQETGPSDFIFRQTDNGKFILPPAGADSKSKQEAPVQPQPSPNLSSFLKFLAAHTRGIPGIAWAFWRHSLYLAIEPEPEEDRAGGQEGKAAKGDAKKTIWVKPWPQLARPTVPGLPERPQLLLVLHALMLHGGLWNRIIPELVPFSPSEIIEYLFLLESAGLVESDQGFWRVTPLGYPAVRHSLQNEGYLTDVI